MYKKFTIIELADTIDVHPDTLYKAKRKGYCSRKLSEKLAEVTGLPMSMWFLGPMDGLQRDPWDVVLK